MKPLPDPCGQCGRHVREAAPARSGTFAEHTLAELRDAYAGSLRRAAGRGAITIVAVCIRCQDVILAEDVKVRRPNGYLHARCVNGPFQPPQDEEAPCAS